VRTKAGIMADCTVIAMDVEKQPRCKVRFDREGSPRGGALEEEWIEVYSDRIERPPEGNTASARKAWATFEAWVWPAPPAGVEELEGHGLQGFPGKLRWRMPKSRKMKVVSFVVAIAVLCFLDYIAFDSTLRAGTIIRLPPRIVGLLFMSAGTNFTEALNCVAVARSGEAGRGMCNALGLPIFDILFGLGLPWLIRNLVGYKVVFPDYKEWLLNDVVLFAVAVSVFVIGLMLERFHMTRRLGVLLLVSYFAFVLYALISGPLSIPAVVA